MRPGTRVLDVDDVEFAMTHRTPTAPGFDVLRGHPVARGGRSSIVLTPDLADHFERHRMAPGRADLPVRGRVVLTLRRRLAFNTRHEKRAWWQAHHAALAKGDQGTLRALAAERGVHPATAAAIRRQLCGIRRPSQASWLDVEAKALLLSNRPRRKLSALLGLTPIYISFPRKKLRGNTDPAGDAAIRRGPGASTNGTVPRP